MRKTAYRERFYWPVSLPSGLSAERAKAVAKYFIACGIDPNRLITVGNGNTKMVADPGSADAYLNRRTDVFFKIIEE